VRCPAIAQARCAYTNEHCVHTNAVISVRCAGLKQGKLQDGRDRGRI
jgi:hypothetical protein